MLSQPKAKPPLNGAFVPTPLRRTWNVDVRSVHFTGFTALLLDIAGVALERLIGVSQELRTGLRLPRQHARIVAEQTAL